jgi:hypothetical protein
VSTAAVESPLRLCRGIRSPFGNRPFRRCTECTRYEWEVRDLRPAMEQAANGTWHCPREIPRAA